MSIYFFSAKQHEIKALTGIKAIVLPKEDLDEGLQLFFGPRYDKREDIDLREELINVFLRDHVPEHFKEEYDHFQCLIHSNIANVFHINHLLLRLCYSSFTIRKSQLLIQGKLRPSRVHREVLRYFRNYTLFHFVAYPYVETHFLLTADSKQNFEENGIIYGKRIQKCMDKLENSQLLIKKDYTFIGNIIDRNYWLLKQSGLENLLKQEFESFQYLKDRGSIRILLYLIGFEIFPLLIIPSLWPALIKVLLKNINRVYPYLLGRLFPESIIKGNMGALPGILSSDFTIDPAGFNTGQRELPSQEPVYSSEIAKKYADLLWHILSRIAVVYTMKSLGVDQSKIYSYFRMLRCFNERWAPFSINARMMMSSLDNSIIAEILHSPVEIRSIVSNGYLKTLSRVGVSFFNRTIDSFHNHLSDHESGLGDALNCSYMHI